MKFDGKFMELGRRKDSGLSAIYALVIFAEFESYLKPIPLFLSSKFLAILLVCLLFYRLSSRNCYYNFPVKCTEVSNLANFTQN